MAEESTSVKPQADIAMSEEDQKKQALRAVRQGVSLLPLQSSRANYLCANSRVLLCRLQLAIRQVSIHPILRRSPKLIQKHRFMWTLHTANPEHWVPLSTVASFKRMREYTTLGNEWLLNSLRASDELEVDEAGKNIRRKTEVTEPAGQFERSIYAVSLASYLLTNHSYGSLERVWRRGSWIAAKVGRVFRSVWEDERCSYA